MGRVAHMEAAQRFVRQPPDGDHASADGESTGKRQAGYDLGACGQTVPGRVPGMRRDDVPEQNVSLELERAENAVHDCRRHLRRPAAGQLPLGRERDPRDACAAIARCFPDENDRGGRPLGEVLAEAFAEQGRAGTFGVLVERRADPGRRELGDECARR